MSAMPRRGSISAAPARRSSRTRNWRRIAGRSRSPRTAEAWRNLGVAQAGGAGWRGDSCLQAGADPFAARQGVVQPRGVAGQAGNPQEKLRSYRKAVEADHNFGEAWPTSMMYNALGRRRRVGRRLTARGVAEPETAWRSRSSSSPPPRRTVRQTDQPHPPP